MTNAADEPLRSFPCCLCDDPIIEQYSPAGVKYLPAILLPGDRFAHPVCYFTPTVTIQPRIEEDQ
jgi:hypothetical protein